MKRIKTAAAILIVIISASALCACEIAETVEPPTADTYGSSEVTETDETVEDSRETEKESDLNDSNITEEDETKTNDSPANDKNWTVAA